MSCLRLRQAFDSHPATSIVPITGISRKGKEGTSYRIRVGDEGNVRKVKEHREWIASHFEGAKIKEDTEYLVVVDGVDKETICDESKTKIRPTAHEEIGEENNISISRIRFLAGGNPGGNKCSVIIHMPDKREADHITSKQYMESETRWCSQGSLCPELALSDASNVRGSESIGRENAPTRKQPARNVVWMDTRPMSATATRPSASTAVAATWPAIGDVQYSSGHGRRVDNY